MKKFLAMMLAVLAVCSMAACAKKQPAQNQMQGGIETVEKPETGNVQSVSYEDPMQVAQAAMDARNAYEYSGVLVLIHEKCAKDVAARLRMNVEDMYAMYDENAAGIRQETEKDKGAFTVSGQLGAQTALEGEELAAVQKRYLDKYDLTVTEAVRVDFTVFYEFASGTEESAETMVIVCIDGLWYLDLASIRLL